MTVNIFTAETRQKQNLRIKITTKEAVLKVILVILITSSAPTTLCHQLLRFAQQTWSIWLQNSDFTVEIIEVCQLHKPALLNWVTVQNISKHLLRCYEWFVPDFDEFPLESGKNIWIWLFSCFELSLAFKHSPFLWILILHE